MTFYDWWKVGQRDIDIYDNIFDYEGVCFVYEETEEEKESIDIVLDYIARNLEVEKEVGDWLVCKINDFCMKHKNIFDNFMNENYNEEWQPQVWEKHYGRKLTDNEEEFCDYYLDLFNCLIYGGVSEETYNYFAKAFQENGGDK